MYKDLFKQALEDDEDKVNYAYQDSLGYWTIGIGHLIDKRLGGRISDKIVYAILEEDVAEAERVARKFVRNFDNISDNRKVVILSLAFNLGETKLAKFINTLKAVNEERWDDAGDNLESSLWYHQVKTRGPKLVKMLREG